mmetsp:Transcript_61477/g.150465  ORF Transcript_61477/g.150465 Transcript_61477/m.150465 type:complete len:88 (+) Transcript_61477:356-619(+)
MNICSCQTIQSTFSADNRFDCFFLFSFLVRLDERFLSLLESITYRSFVRNFCSIDLASTYRGNSNTLFIMSKLQTNEFIMSKSQQFV